MCLFGRVLFAFAARSKRFHIRFALRLRFRELSPVVCMRTRVCVIASGEVVFVLQFLAQWIHSSDALFCQYIVHNPKELCEGFLHCAPKRAATFRGASHLTLIFMIC